MPLSDEFTIAWDGEPSMSGQPHRYSTGSFSSLEEAKHALKMVPSFRSHPGKNQRIEKRQVSDWEFVDHAE